MTEQIRCTWPGDDLLYQQYHDSEWGVPCREDKKLFEFVLLEGAQAGLSWITILRKRDAYRSAFADFDVDKVATFTDQDVERCVQDAGIVRNRLKINSAVSNAKLFIDIQKSRQLRESSGEPTLSRNRREARFQHRGRGHGAKSRGKV